MSYNYSLVNFVANLCCTIESEDSSVCRNGLGSVSESILSELVLEKRSDFMIKLVIFSISEH